MKRSQILTVENPQLVLGVVDELQRCRYGVIHTVLGVTPQRRFSLGNA